MKWVLGMERITDRIWERATQLKLQQKQIAKATGATSPTVNNWFNHASEPSAKYLEDLANVLNVSIQWLVTGYGLDKNVLDENIKIRKAPVLSLYEVSEFQKYVISTQDEKREYEYFVDNGFSEELFWIKAKHDVSTSPTFIAGDLILIDTKREPRTGNCVIVILDGDSKATLRKFRICFDEKANKEYFQLVAENDFYPKLDSRHNRFSIKGVVVKHERILI